MHRDMLYCENVGNVSDDDRVRWSIYIMNAAF